MTNVVSFKKMFSTSADDLLLSIIDPASNGYPGYPVMVSISDLSSIDLDQIPSGVFVLDDFVSMVTFYVHRAEEKMLDDFFEQNSLVCNPVEKNGKKYIHVFSKNAELEEDEPILLLNSADVYYICGWLHKNNY